MKEKEALRLKKEAELEEQRQQEAAVAAEESFLKAKAELSGPKTIGKIDLNPEKPKAEPFASEKEVAKPESKEIEKVEKKEVDKPEAKEVTEKPVEQKE